jgi:RNA polymerase sigma-70 factor (ECF subfamily)
MHDLAAADVDPAERQLLERLRAGDEDAFMEIVERWSASMLRVAQMFVASRAVAEEVVQETWLAVVNGLDRFEGRSSLKTWIFRILTNRAKTRGERERRTVPFSSLAAAEADAHEPAVDPDRFVAPGDERAGFWGSPPQRWTDIPDKSLESEEALALVRAEIDKLPPMQRLVITMRDLEGWSTEEIRNALDITETNQRVLLHRARAKVRAALEDYFNA